MVDTLLRGKDFSLKVYPVPASQASSLKIVLGSDADLLEFRDLTGRIVYSQAIEKGTRIIYFPGSLLPRGVYLLTVKTQFPEVGRLEVFEVTRKVIFNGQY